MSYVESITGDPINPVPFDYKDLSITANTAYTWSQLAKWNDITASSPCTITMPPANEVGLDEVVFFNYGSNTITINNNASGGITTIAAGIIKRLWITNNSTAAGVWRSSNIGTGTTTADASALAGYGMKAMAGTLSQDTPPNLYNTNQMLGLTHRAGVQIWTGGAGTFSLTAPATLTSGWFCMVRNSGTGILTLTPLSGNIDGASAISMATGEGFTICTDGNNFYTLGRVSAATTGKTLLNKSAGGTGTITLTSTEESYDIINLTGILTGNMGIVVSTTVREWIFNNSTTGAYTLTVKTAAGTGVVIPQGSKWFVYGDGTNIVSTDYAPYSDTTAIIKGSVDNTKQIRFEVDGNTTGTTRIYTVPDANTTIVGTDATQVLTNKTIQGATIQSSSISGSTLVDSTVSFVDNVDPTKQLQFQLSGITTSTTRTLTVPDASDNLLVQNTQQTIINKIMDDSTVFFADNADATKQLKFEVGGFTTGTTRTATYPNKDGTVAYISDVTTAVAAIIAPSITGFLPSSITGTSTTASLLISAGAASDNTLSAIITNNAAMGWGVSAGNAISGYSGGTTLPNNTTIHFYVCSGTTGIGVYAIPNSSYPLAAASAPVGYRISVRRVASINTNGSGALIPLTPVEISGGGVTNYLTTQVFDINGSVPATANRTLYTLSTPLGIKTEVLYRSSINHTTNGSVIFTSGDETDIAPAALITGNYYAYFGASPGFDEAGNSTGGYASRDGGLITNTSGQIGIRAIATAPAVYFITRGFIDFRRD